MQAPVRSTHISEEDEDAVRVRVRTNFGLREKTVLPTATHVLTALQTEREAQIASVMAARKLDRDGAVNIGAGLEFKGTICTLSSVIDPGNTPASIYTNLLFAVVKARDILSDGLKPWMQHLPVEAKGNLRISRDDFAKRPGKPARTLPITGNECI